VELRIFITLKNPSSSAGFEPTNRGSNGKHDDHYTTENNTLAVQLALTVMGRNINFELKLLDKYLGRKYSLKSSYNKIMAILFF
jgi:hypothetical protein